jgi:hypothetical protein
MLSEEDNEFICRTGPGTPMGELLRRYRTPALVADEIPEPDSPPVRFSFCVTGDVHSGSDGPC